MKLRVHLRDIIILKGGKRSMIKEVVRPEEGFEAIYDELLAKREGLDAEKEIAKAEALAKVEEAFAGRQEKIQKAIDAISVVEEVEVEDEDELVEEAASEEVMGEYNGEVAE